MGYDLAVKWMSKAVVSDNRRWWKNPTIILVTAKYEDLDNLNLEYETQLTYYGNTTPIARHKTYIDAMIAHKWYTMKYKLKKR